MSLDVLCLAPSHLSAADAATLLVVPALCDQLNVMCMMANKNATHNPKVKGLLSCFLSFESVNSAFMSAIYSMYTTWSFFFFLLYSLWYVLEQH